MSDEQHVALPHLYGAPAYSRPPRPVQELPRPFDPDELPLEADRTDEDAALAAELLGTHWAPSAATQSKPARRLRVGRSAKVNRAGPATLEGRPFRLQGLGRIFGGDRK